MLTTSFTILSKRIGQIRRLGRIFLVTAFCVFITPFPALSQATTTNCSPKSFNKHVKIVSTFRMMEVFLNTLMHAQTHAILEVQTGIPMSGDDGGFYGPLGLLGKTMDKVEIEMKSVVKGTKRLKFDDQTALRFKEISEKGDEIIAVGFEMVSILKKNEITGATQLFMDRSMPAYRDAFGAVHTVISGTERSSSLQTLKCR
ncbi:hypothetical protein [Kiloniella sp.]|uniref:hypothetical protein n=1 Tax=Kiloniella sp. TaxID=1938587 RepID=UPI003B014990